MYINMREECGLMKREVLKSQITKMGVTCDDKIYIDCIFVCVYVHIYSESTQGEKINISL